MADAEREPAEVFPLAQYLCEEMEERGWTTADVATRMDGDDAENQVAVDIILTVHKDSLVIDEKTFESLAKAFGVSALFFKRLDAVWRRWPDRRALFTAPESLFKPRLYVINT